MTTLRRATKARSTGTTLPPIIRVLEELRKLRKRNVSPEEAVTLLYEATEQKTLIAYTSRQLAELAYSIVMVIGDNNTEQWLNSIGDEIMRRGGQGFYSRDIGSILETFAPRLPSHPVNGMLAHRGVSLRTSMSCSDLCTILWSRCAIADKKGDPGLMQDIEDIMMEMKRKGYDLPSVPPLFRLLKGISTLPSITPLIDSAMDDLAMMISNDDSDIRSQLEPKQVNFLLYALTGYGIVNDDSKWRGRRKLLEVMMPIVSGYINDGALSRDTAVSCLRAYARSCAVKGNDMTYLTKELITAVTPWIQGVLNTSVTLPITWLSNMLFIYSSSSETCFDYKSEATPMVIGRIVSMLEAQRYDIPAVKCVDIISYMARVGIVSDTLLDYCITNSMPSGRLLRAICKLGINVKQVEVLLSKGECIATEDWILPMAIAFVEGGAKQPSNDMIEKCRMVDGSKLTEDVILGLYILDQYEGFMSVNPSQSSWVLEAAKLVGDGAVPGFVMDNGYRLQLAIPNERVSIRLVQPKGYILQREDMSVRLSARHRARGELMRMQGWKEICISSTQWNSTNNDEEKLALIMHAKVSDK